MSDRSSSSRPGASALAVAFLATAVAAFLGMRWNMLEPRWGFPAGTKMMLLAAVVMAGLSRFLGKTRPGLTILIVGGAVPVGGFVIIVLEILKDPTSQNLWPVSVVMLGVIGLAASLVGTLIGSLALWLAREMRSGGGGTV